MTKDNNCIGNFNLDGIPPAPRGIPWVDSEANGELSKDYRVFCKTGDTGGTLLQINPRNNRVSASYYVKGKVLGRAFV